ncbi:MAG TPA: hypothetical protein VNF00_01060 [Candidatus Acidoferrales bacterium]|nr:hypothetical protein [Candidatus Acidoferrales bacterium]
MRKLVSLLGFLVIVSLALPRSAHAQKAELFGGYSYVRFNSSPGGQNSKSTTNFNGWNASLDVNTFKFLGFKADFGGTYTSPFGVSTHLYTFLFGPQLNLPTPFVSPFVHALFGGARLGSSAGGVSASSTSFASAIGGGIDVHPLPLVGLRLIQADYLTTHFAGTRQNNIRISAGIVLRF